MTYRPTPRGLARDVVELLHVLTLALRRLTEIEEHREEMTAGSCYDETRA